jgi:hypothetical protein
MTVEIQKPAADGAQAAGASEGPTEKTPEVEYSKIAALRLGERYIIEYEICHSRRSCRDTVHVVLPPTADRRLYRKAVIELRVGERALVLYRQWSFKGNLKWNSLCVYKAEADGVYGACWSYDEWSSVDEIVTAARSAWKEVSALGIERWREVLELWWKPARERYGILIDDVVYSAEHD